MKKDRRLTLRPFLIAIALLIARVEPLWPARAQAAEKIWRIGLLSPATRDSFHDNFFKGLKELGYVEGRNFFLESRVAAANEKRLAEAAVQLTKLRVDVIVARGTQATLAAKKTTATIPIVMTGSSDPVGTGLVTSLAPTRRERHGHEHLGAGSGAKTHGVAQARYPTSLAYRRFMESDERGKR